MVQIPEKMLTLEEFLQLPETKPASEYIDGQVFQKPMPQGKHSKLQGKLVTKINEIAEVQRIGLAFPELRCTFGGRSTVPDITVFAWDRIPVDPQGNVANVFELAPDWTIEILSPDQSLTRVTRNILHCLEHGCQSSWVIDPDERLVLIYPPGQQPSYWEEPADLLPVPTLLPNLHITVGELFGWLQLNP